MDDVKSMWHCPEKDCTSSVTDLGFLRIHMKAVHNYSRDKIAEMEKWKKKAYIEMWECPQEGCNTTMLNVQLMQIHVKAVHDYTEEMMSDLQDHKVFRPKTEGFTEVEGQTIFWKWQCPEKGCNTTCTNVEVIQLHLSFHHHYSRERIQALKLEDLYVKKKSKKQYKGIYRCPDCPSWFLCEGYLNLHCKQKNHGPVQEHEENAVNVSAQESSTTEENAPTKESSPIEEVTEPSAQNAVNVSAQESSSTQENAPTKESSPMEEVIEPSTTKESVTRALSVPESDFIVLNVLKHKNVLAVRRSKDPSIQLKKQTTWNSVYSSFENAFGRKIGRQIVKYHMLRARKALFEDKALQSRYQKVKDLCFDERFRRLRDICTKTDLLLFEDKMMDNSRTNNIKIDDSDRHEQINALLEEVLDEAKRRMRVQKIVDDVVEDIMNSKENDSTATCPSLDLAMDIDTLDNNKENDSTACPSPDVEMNVESSENNKENKSAAECQTADVEKDIEPPDNNKENDSTAVCPSPDVEMDIEPLDKNEENAWTPTCSSGDNEMDIEPPAKKKRKASGMKRPLIRVEQKSHAEQKAEGSDRKRPLVQMEQEPLAKRCEPVKENFVNKRLQDVQLEHMSVMTTHVKMMEAQKKLFTLVTTLLQNQIKIGCIIDQNY